MTLPLSAVAAATGGRLLGEDATIRGLSIDSRRVERDHLFVALAGERTDGHGFVEAAGEAGAGGALISRPLETTIPRVLVEDTEQAMGALAASWRQRFDLPVAGVTGSNGKTTVKGMLGAILGQRWRCLVTPGNYNNELGLPLTLSLLDASTEAMVLEMGCGKPGDIDYLAGIGRPRVGIITNASAAHLERLGTIEGVAKVKGELISALPADGVAILNRNDDHYAYWCGVAGDRRIISFGTREDADVFAAYQHSEDGPQVELQTPAGSLTCALPVAGAHNASNAAAAAAAALAFGLGIDEIEAGLAAFEPEAGRLRSLRPDGGWILLEDTYNANPASLAAGIRVLVEHAGERWLVLGDMAELGPEEEALHFQSGALARRLGVERLFALGPLARHAAMGFGDGAQHFDDREVLVAALAAALEPRVVCLIKGSRSARMEEVSRALAGEAACS
ncbi:MAG: UDP-N-acetylmuramoyl-tripeptide--D-alanyl-D-alanine ligase [Pseudomonadota bacterium]